jgi:hypothetical protein
MLPAHIHLQRATALQNIFRMKCSPERGKLIRTTVSPTKLWFSLSRLELNKKITQDRYAVIKVPFFLEQQ